MKLTSIAAVGENNELGKDNKLLWHLPDDFKRFKLLTSGHNVIMGRKTFDSLPGILPNRRHVIITRNKDYRNDKVDVVHSLEEAIEVVKNNGDNTPYVIGGGEIYKQFMDKCDVLEITRVHGEFESDTFFPEIDENNWELSNSEYRPTDGKHKYPFTYETWVKK